MRTFVPLLVIACLSGCPSAPPDDDDTTAEPVTPGAPCASWFPGAALGNVADPDFNELSGLAASRTAAGIWTHEDSGAEASLIHLDRTGATLGVATLPGVVPYDNEDLALGRCGGEPAPSEGGPTCLVLGDVGDNAGTRSEIALHRVREPDVAALERPWTLSLEVETLRVVYPDGPHNVEGLVLEPDGSPVLVTKRNDGLAHLYRVPATGWGAEPITAEWIGTITVGTAGGLPDSVTGAALSVDGRRLLLRTYIYGYLVELGDGGLEVAPEVMPRALPVAPEMQGEAIAWDADGRGILTVGEAERPALNLLRCRD